MLRGLFLLVCALGDSCGEVFSWPSLLGICCDRKLSDTELLLLFLLVRSFRLLPLLLVTVGVDV